MLTNRPECAIIIPERDKEDLKMFNTYTNPDFCEIVGDLLEDFAEWLAYEADLAESDPWVN